MCHIADALYDVKHDLLCLDLYPNSYKSLEKFFKWILNFTEILSLISSDNKMLIFSLYFKLSNWDEMTTI